MGFAACSSDDETAEKPTTTSAAAPTKCDNTIVDVAVGNPDFSTLVAAVTEAGLVDTLNGEGPFTVFAPTNEAFAKIPAADLDAILADKEKLTAILTFHVVGGKVMAADLKPGSQKVVTVNGEEAEVVVSEAGVTYAGAKVVTTDIETCNGVIHVIDAVVVPMG
ncbi:MAG: fasciclin domain-containing protein [Acidimicrobiia bacterium]|nr:fasciclin domain-containing protein [Acidimicrobiia bacterium]MBJ7513971.1 fasciclin domain-containing protein [Acidimicrobiia bacterium]